VETRVQKSGTGPACARQPSSKILTAFLMTRSNDAPNLGAFNQSQPLLSSFATPACLMLLLHLHKECILLIRIRTPHLHAHVH
jgi:hypothetical protein